LRPIVTLNGIDEAINNLNYVNKKSLKYRLVREIRKLYLDESSIESVTEIEMDDLIRLLWETGDDESAIKNRRKNFYSIKSSINNELKKLYEEGKNGEGIIIGTANVFDMSDEAKSEMLESFAYTSHGDSNIPLGKITDVLKIVNDILSKDQSSDDSDNLLRMEQLKELVQSISQKVGVSGIGDLNGLEDAGIKIYEDDSQIEEGEEDELEEIDEIVPEDEPEEIDDDEELEELEIEEEPEDEELIEELEPEDELEEVEDDEELEELETEEEPEDEELIEELEPDDAVEEIDDEGDLEELEIEEKPEDEELIEELDPEDELAEIDEDEDFEELEVDEEPEDEELIEELDSEDELEEIDAEEEPKDEELIEELEPDDAVEEIDDKGDLEELEIEEEPEDEDLIEELEAEDELAEIDEDEDFEELEVDEEPEDDELIEELDPEDKLEEIDEEEEMEDLDAEEEPEDEELIEELDPEDAVEEIDDEEAMIGDLSLDEILAQYGEYGFEGEEGIKNAQLLSDLFNHALSAMDTYYNQYVLIPKGKYIIGSNNSSHDSKHTKKVISEPFYFGKFPITNALFEVFIEKTGYITTAEKVGFGTVYFGRYQKKIDPKTGLQTLEWNSSLESRIIDGACWYQPYGPGSTLHNKRNHPVVQVSLKDAMAFAAWTGKRLPTEEEWEAASRTSTGFEFPWGNEIKKEACNIEESYTGDTTPVDKYTDNDNSLGISDTLGNVMEWTLNKINGSSSDYIVKGGSWVSGNDARLYSRFFLDPESTSNILGFRCVAY
jgi:formylglycine-generating enzyme required for sulfatase activity